VDARDDCASCIEISIADAGKSLWCQQYIQALQLYWNSQEVSNGGDCIIVSYNDWIREKIEEGSNCNGELSLAFRDSKKMLSTAVRVNALESVKEFIAAGADLEEKDSIGMTALHRVFDPVITTRPPPHRYAIFKELLAAGANVNAATPYGATPLMLCLWRIDDPRYVRLLLRHGASATAQLHGETVFYMALKRGKYQEAAYILQAGANPLVGDDLGCEDTVGDGIFVREELVDLILTNTRDLDARVAYVEAGKKVLEGLLIVLESRPSVPVFACNEWPCKNFIADYTTERVSELYRQFCSA
jgi:hypothetical protein